MANPQETIEQDGKVLIRAASGIGFSIINEIQKKLNGQNYTVPNLLTYYNQSRAWFGAENKAVLFNEGDTELTLAQAVQLVEDYINGVTSAPKRSKAKNMSNGTKAVLTNDKGVPLKDFADNALEVGNEN